LVKASGYVYAIPLNVVEETTRLEQNLVLPGSEKYGRGSYYRYNGETLPLYTLSDLVHLPAHAQRESDFVADDDMLGTTRREHPLLIITGAQRYALTVDNLEGQQEVVVKGLGSHLKGVRGVVGATILGSGQVILILNVYELLDRNRGSQRHLSGFVPSGVRSSNQMMDLSTGRTLSEAEIQEREEADLRSRSGEQAAPAKLGTGTLPPLPTGPKLARTPVIQVVDDSLSIRKVLSSALEKAGFRVRTSKDGQEALETIQQNAPDLIVMDIEMPRMDGYQLTAILKSDAAFNAIPIVMLTSRAGLKHRQKAEEVGADGFLVKPYKEEELLGIVSELLVRTN
jgi:chemosensory pili system protein ChpA (sensor histidine kinase/response regulator)